MIIKIIKMEEEKPKLLFYLLGVLGGVLLLILLTYLAFGQKKIVSPLPEEGIKVIFVTPTSTPIETPISPSPSPKTTPKITAKPTSTPILTSSPISSPTPTP